MLKSAIGRGRAGIREPRTATSITKEGGGNWLAGSVEGAMKPLKGKELSPEDLALARSRVAEYKSKDPDWSVGQARALDQIERDAKLNQFIDKQLTRYVKNQMATKEDPIRALAEKGTLHVNPEQLNFNPESYGKYLGAGQKVVAQSPTAKSWEGVSDLSISPTIAKQLLNNDGSRMGRGESILENNPWLNKVPEETNVYSMTDQQGVPSDLGFDHLIDELRNATNPASGLPRELLIKPESLSKLSVPQAVERVAKINEWRAAQMEAARKAAREGIPVHKEYKEGYQWTSAPDTAADEKALQYIKDVGCEGGWCTQGESAAKEYGGGNNRLYVLHDPQGKAVTQISVKQKDLARAFGEIPDEERYAIAQKVKDEYFGGAMPGRSNEDKYFELLDQEYIKRYGEPAPSIAQIKGKRNDRPNAEYLPFVQDFVKSGKWSDVGDFHNTGLMRIAPESNEALYLQKQNKPIPEYVSDQEYEEIRRGMADAMRSPYGAADEMKDGGVAHLDKGGAPETPEQELQRFLRMLRINATGGKDQYGSSVGGRLGLNIPVSENVSIEPYVQGFAFKPDSGKLMNSGAGGANLNIRFNNGGKVSQDAMRLAVMHKQLRKHHG
jgi:hypothetical protein